MSGPSAPVLPRGDARDRPLAVASSALPGLEPEPLAATVAGSGLAGVEWGAGAGHPLAADPAAGAAERLARVGADQGLVCCGLAVHDGDALEGPPSRWRRLGEAAAALGAPHVRVYATAPDGDFTAGFDLLRRRLAVAAEGVAAAGRRLLLEPAPATLVPAPGLAVRALAGIDPRHAGVVYDPGSLAREGWLDPFLATGVLGPLLRHVHAKNLSPQRDPDGTWVWRRATLAGGIVDWPRVTAALDACGYDGWLVLDHLSAPTVGCMTAERDYLLTVSGGVRG